MKSKIERVRLPSKAETERIEEECRNDPELQRKSHEVLAAANATCQVFASLAADFREARETLGLSLRDLSEQTGVTAPALSLLERGKGNPTIDTLRRISAALGMEIEVVAKASVKS